MKNEKYLVLLENQNTSALRKIEREFKVSLTSSQDLSSTHKSFDIIDDQNGVLYKNLDVVVADDLDADQLKAAVKSKDSPVIYYEKERTFLPANQQNLLDELKKTSQELSEKIAELEAFLQKKPLPQEPLTNYEWGLKAVGIDQVQLTGKGVDVCILDTGFDVSHPDFVAREIEGKSFVANENWDKDVYGHGTHCAGTAAGNVRSDNGHRYGVASECNLKIAKVLSDTGKGTTSAIIDAIDWALEKKFRIISMSLASPVQINEKPSPLFQAVGKKALENNCLLIAAAGNDSSRPGTPRPVSAPANCSSVMAVAAIDSQMRVASFSNGGINAANGGNVNVCAPGVDVLSAFPRKSGRLPYKLMNGTSMAAPHVSGIAALLMQKFPALNAEEIWQLLEQYARPVQNLKYRDIGAGLVQVKI
ncbi:S8 family peptidase [Chryseobacterium sp. MFBS3-17]|uniref:S8 family peptidase n=1 Tax=Chryseobacterium sp. MFBS3-17 TaxID=2886689 RepID=UPI001D0E6AFE|nr:S8 family serine peptidase [Chryseobacterium sp. MFBS3-17]MCC2589585.1 S8 family serine peptidase [Chryseobacterium sp. MFBS3-17]